MYVFTLSFKFSNRYINIYDCYKKKEEEKKLYQIAINYTRLITIIGKLVISTLGGFRISVLSPLSFQLKRNKKSLH